MNTLWRKNMKKKKYKVLLLLAFVITFISLTLMNKNSTVAQSFVKNIVDLKSGQEVVTVEKEIVPIPLLLPPGQDSLKSLSSNEYYSQRKSYAASIDLELLEKLIETSVMQIDAFVPNNNDSNEARNEEIEKILANNPISWQILSSLTYHTDKGVIAISASKPSSDASEKLALLGNETIELQNKNKSWVSTVSDDQMFPNRIVFLKDDLIITIAGSVDLDLLSLIASNVEFH
jgi:hypothetical protein